MIMVTGRAFIADSFDAADQTSVFYTSTVLGSTGRFIVDVLLILLCLPNSPLSFSSKDTDPFVAPFFVQQQAFFWCFIISSTLALVSFAITLPFLVDSSFLTQKTKTLIPITQFVTTFRSLDKQFFRLFGVVLVFWIIYSMSVYSLDYLLLFNVIPLGESYPPSFLTFVAHAVADGIVVFYTAFWASFTQNIPLAVIISSFWGFTVFLGLAVLDYGHGVMLFLAVLVALTLANFLWCHLNSYPNALVKTLCPPDRFATGFAILNAATSIGQFSGGIVLSPPIKLDQSYFHRRCSFSAFFFFLFGWLSFSFLRRDTPQQYILEPEQPNEYESDYHDIPQDEVLEVPKPTYVTDYDEF